MVIRTAPGKTIEAWSVLRLADGTEVWREGRAPSEPAELLEPGTYWTADAGDARKGGIVRPARAEETEAARAAERIVAERLGA